MAANLIPGDVSIRAFLKSDNWRLPDGAGLYVLREGKKGGSPAWHFDYTRPAGGRTTLSLGTYPATGLALARQKAKQAREQLAEGSDPSADRKAAKAAKAKHAEAQALIKAGLPVPGTFEHVARAWLTTIHEAKVSAGHAERTRIRFEQDAFPWIGPRPLAEIDAPELLTVLRRVTARGAIETAHRLKDACGQDFRYGISTGACARDPPADLRDALPPVPSRHHAAIVDPVAAGKLLRDVAEYVGQPVTRAALQLSALLLLRPGELRQMEWVWVDLDEAMLTVPAGVMKRKKDEKINGAPHHVPLAPQAVATLRELRPLTGTGRYVFPSLHSAARCMSENTVRGALRRMGYGNDDMTAHGFRAMARTLIAERLDVAPEVIEAQLAHAVKDANGRAYNRTSFVEQRRDMMKRWADYLDRLRDGAQVIALNGRAA